MEFIAKISSYPNYFDYIFSDKNIYKIIEFIEKNQSTLYNRID